VRQPETAVDSRLIRSYRRLVHFYPPGPRREELLDTLVECAAPGRRRPAPREIVDLTVHGARARLGRPRSRGIVVLALLIALAGGFLGACLANRLGLEAIGPLPTGAEATRLQRTIFPGLTVWGGGDAAKIVSQSDGESIEYGYATSWVKHVPATRDVAAYTATARRRLEADGWKVISVDPPLDETDQVDANPGDRAAGFTAVRGDLGLHFTDSFWPGRPPYDSDGNAIYLVWHRPPAWLTALTWLGALVGAAVAFLLTGWASRRTEPHPGAGALAGTGAVFALICLLPAVLSGLPGSVADETESPFWQGLVDLGTAPAMLAGLLALLILGCVTLLSPRPWSHRTSRAPGTRALWRRPSPVIALIAVGAILAGLALRHDPPTQSCLPSAPSGITDPPSARMSYLSRVYLDPKATDDQRNLAQAAIGRGFGGGLTFDGGPRSPTFGRAYCGYSRIPAAEAETLPWYWTVDLSSPGLFGGLAAEVMAMPGVVAAQHVPTG
jgi:hypothetical protein